MGTESKAKGTVKRRIDVVIFFDDGDQKKLSVLVDGEAWEEEMHAYLLKLGQEGIFEVVKKADKPMTIHYLPPHRIASIRATDAGEIEVN